MLAAIKLEGEREGVKKKACTKQTQSPPPTPPPPLQDNIYTSSEAPHMHTSMPKRDIKYNQFKCHGSW